MFLPGLAVALKIVSIVIASWIVIHLLGAFGIFLALAFPVWWFIAPKSTVCLNCQARNKGDWCSFCKETIHNDKHPKNFKSTLLNSILILLFSLLSMGLVYIEYKIISSSGIVSSDKSVQFAVDGNNKFRLNEVFPMEIKLTDIKTPINTVHVDLSYDPNSLEALEISTENSFATVFIAKEVNNDVGFVRLTGGLPNPGYSHSSGTFGTVFFRAKAPGVASVDFLPTSVVLANDSRGTNVLRSFPSATFYVVAEQVKEQDEVYTLDQIHLDSNVLATTDENTQLNLYLRDRVDNAVAIKNIDEIKSQSYSNTPHTNRFKDTLKNISLTTLNMPGLIIKSLIF